MPARQKTPNGPYFPTYPASPASPPNSATTAAPFVAKDRSQLNGLVNSGQRLERKDSPGKDAILQEFKTYKRNFKPDRFGLAIP